MRVSKHGPRRPSFETRSFGPLLRVRWPANCEDRVMDALSDNDLALMKFGVGQPVPRKEDPTLLRGEGRYTDDINLPGQAYAVMVRSRIAHGILKGIDAKAADRKSVV